MSAERDPDVGVSAERDPFGTAGLRAGVLAAWAGSPTRLREDTAAEADLVVGGYRDRLLTELAQNAHDAALRAGTAGRLTVDVRPDDAGGAVLHVGNTGAPLDRAGVAALASLRASGKAGTGSVGRYGVGFTAVLTVSDAPQVRSTSGSVGFSAARTRAALGVAAATAVPVLRLAWPVPDGPAPGCDTEVVAPLRPGVDPAALLATARALAPELLLELPALAEVVVAGEVLRRNETRAGDAATVLTVDGRTWLRVVAGPATWLVETRDGAPVPGGDDVLRAPTRTDEELSLPARLLLAAPLAPDRRRLLPGPAGTAALAAAAAAYPRLVRAVAPAHRPRLVPRPGFPRSAVDDHLREGALAALRTEAWLPAAAPGDPEQDAGAGPDLAPGRAQVLDEASPALVALLADVLPGLLPAELAAGEHARALAAVGVARTGPAALADALAGVSREPGWWHDLYAALDALPGTAHHLGELAALPVPLADGRTVLGARSTRQLTAPDGAGTTGPGTTGLDAAGLAALGLRVVHPAAAHPLLGRLGARVVGPGELLADERVRAAVTAADWDDPAAAAALADAVLALVAAAPPAPGEPAWLGGLLLPDDTGELRAADELLLPGAPLAAVLAEDAPVGVLAADVVTRHGAAVLRAVGVGWGFAVVVDEDPAGPDHDLDEEEQWWWAGAADAPGPLRAVRDLDLVDPARWPAALALLAAEPDTLAAAREPGGHTGWWLARHATLAGQPVGALRAPDDDTLAGLLDPAPAEHAPVLAAALARLDPGSPAGAGLLLDRLADPARHPDAATTARVHGLLARAVATGALDPDEVDPPARVRTADAATWAGEGAGAEALVLDDAWLAPLLTDARTVLTDAEPAALAELLDLDLASEVVTGRVAAPGTPTRWAQDPAAVRRCAALGRPVPAGTVHRHDRLVVATGTGPAEVPWWVERGGTVHAGPGGTADALLHVLGREEEPR